MVSNAKQIDYQKLLTNVLSMINLLEFDAMRSAGKSKLNSGTLVDLYSLKERYENVLNISQEKPVASVQETVAPVKRTVGRPAIKNN